MFSRAILYKNMNNNKNLKDAFEFLTGKEASEYIVFTIICSMDRDYPELKIFDRYSEEQISKTKRKAMLSTDHY